MLHFGKILLLSFMILFTASGTSVAQLQIISQNTAQALAQKLVGNGVVISNATLVASPSAAGFFYNEGGTKLDVDSGIVLTNGRAKSEGNAWGLDGNGITAASAVLASLDNLLPGDGDIARTLGIPVTDTYDATVLEFDFVPLGDSIKFRYVFSSEEYTPDYVCSFNDAFAFFISGPGISGGVRNIALVPNTNIPVSIFNVNDVAGGGCPNNTAYFFDNTNNTFLTHDGHTVVLTALEKVQPCQTYHLKLVISDVGDGLFDSGVFLEAKSLSSNVVSLQHFTQVDAQNNNYLVEGCWNGSVKVIRPLAYNSPLNVTLSYAGSAVNGTDIQPLPLSVTIPANQTEVLLDIIPLIDNLPEGVEVLKIYALGGCNATIPSDSVLIQIRDYDTLGIHPDTAIICKNTAIQLTATAGYSVYKWDANPTLSNTAIPNPLVLPVSSKTTYYCTATEGACNARDSSFIELKILDFISKRDINCKNDASGEIRVSGGAEWAGPVQYSINNGAYQNDSTFLNLPVGVYTVKIKDATGCTDSLLIPIAQLYPDLLITGAPVTAASCTGGADGTITVAVTGGKNPYLFSADGLNYQASNLFNLPQGNYIITVKDNNGCTNTATARVLLNNIVTVDAGVNVTICEGKSTQLAAISNATGFAWSPATALSNNSIKNPLAYPVQTTLYKVTATTGICTQTDSVTVFVNPAPKPDAGPDAAVCFEKDIQLTGAGGISYWWYPVSYLDDPRIASPFAKRLPGTITYSLHVTDRNGCASLKSDSVIITVARPAVLNAGKDAVLAMGQPLQLFAADVNNTGFTQYQWSPSYGLDNPFAAGPVTVLDRDVHYYVTASNSIGCTATDDIIIKVYRGPDIYVPNAFTPDGNGLNDILKAIPVGIKDFRYFRIYNRWGQTVFNTNNPNFGWDGKTSGALPQPGTYTWLAEGTDYKGNSILRKGTVTIVR